MLSAGNGSGKLLLRRDSYRPPDPRGLAVLAVGLVPWTIVPDIIIHTLGDLARLYFGVLQGDGSLLFVS